MSQSGQWAPNDSLAKLHVKALPQSPLCRHLRVPIHFCIPGHRSAQILYDQCGPQRAHKPQTMRDKAPAQKRDELLACEAVEPEILHHPGPSRHRRSSPRRNGAGVSSSMSSSSLRLNAGLESHSFTLSNMFLFPTLGTMIDIAHFSGFAVVPAAVAVVLLARAAPLPPWHRWNKCHARHGRHNSHRGAKLSHNA